MSFFKIFCFLVCLSFIGCVTGREESQNGFLEKTVYSQNMEKISSERKLVLDEHKRALQKMFADMQADSEIRNGVLKEILRLSILYGLSELTEMIKFDNKE